MQSPVQKACPSGVKHRMPYTVRLALAVLLLSSCWPSLYSLHPPQVCKAVYLQRSCMLRVVVIPADSLCSRWQGHEGTVPG